MKNVKRLLILLLLSNTFSLFSQNKTSIYFDSGKSDITSESESSLKSLVDQILRHSDVDLRIEAFTDDKGTDAFNQQLAQQRAGAVRIFLSNRQISLQKLEIRSIGELGLDAKEVDIEASRRKNRRVDVYFTPIAIGNIDDLSARIVSNSTVTKDINAQTSAVISGTNGVKIEIPADAFLLANGQIAQGSVKVTLKEALKPTEWLFNNLSTVSNDGQIMSSGGMFNIEATANGKPLQLAANKKIKIAVPSATKANPEMQLFYGTNHNPAAPQPVSWSDNKNEWESANMGNSERSLYLQNLGERYTACIQTNSLVKPQLPTPFNTSLLAIALGTKPQTPNLDAPSVPKIRNFDHIPLPTGNRAKRKEIKKRQEQIAKSEASLDKRKKLYETNLAEYKQGWAMYKTDSAGYIEANIYLAECRAKLDSFETAYIKYKVVEDFNRVVTFKKYLLNLDRNNRNNRNIWYEKDFYWLLNYQQTDSDIEYGYDKLRLTVGYKPNLGSIIHLIGKNNKPLYSDYHSRIGEILKASNLLAIDAKIQKDYEDWLKNKVTLSVNEVNEYVGEVSKMGWVNCDVFYKYDVELAKPVVLKETEEARTFLICKKINAILPMKRSKDKTVYGFGKVPADLDIVVVSIKIKDGFPLLSISKLDKLPTEALIPTYQKVSVPQLKEALAAL